MLKLSARGHLLVVGHERLGSGGVALGKAGCAAKSAPAAGILAVEQMVAAGALVHQFPGAGNPQTLFGAAMGLHLGHVSTSLNTLDTGLSRLSPITR